MLGLTLEFVFVLVKLGLTSIVAELRLFVCFCASLYAMLNVISASYN